MHTLAGMQAASGLDGLKEGHNDRSKRLIKGKGSGSARGTPEHSLDGGFGVVAFRTIHHASGSERFDGNVTTSDLAVKVNDSGSDSLADVGSNADKGKVRSGLDDVDVGSQKAPHKVGNKTWPGERERGAGGHIPAPHDTLSRPIAAGQVTECHCPSRVVTASACRKDRT